MKKKALICVVLALIMVLAACGKEKYPGLEELKTLSISLAEEYNRVAQLAINNGWEYDDNSVSIMNGIENVIKNIKDCVADPASLAEGQIETLTKSAQESLDKLQNALSRKFSEPYVPPVPEHENEGEGGES